MDFVFVSQKNKKSEEEINWDKTKIGATVVEWLQTILLYTGQVKLFVVINIFVEALRFIEFIFYDKTKHEFEISKVWKHLWCNAKKVEHFYNFNVK